MSNNQVVQYFLSPNCRGEIVLTVSVDGGEKRCVSKSDGTFGYWNHFRKSVSKRTRHVPLDSADALVWPGAVSVKPIVESARRLAWSVDKCESEVSSGSWKATYAFQYVRKSLQSLLRKIG